MTAGACAPRARRAAGRPVHATLVRMASRCIAYPGAAQSLRCKGVLDALVRLRPFLEQATDERGADRITVEATHAAVEPARLAGHVAGEWRATTSGGRPALDWQAPGAWRFRSPDPPGEDQSTTHDALQSLVADLEGAGAPIIGSVYWDFLLRDPATGALLPFRSEDFASDGGPRSWMTLFVQARVSVQLVAYFPWDDPDERFLAVCRQYDRLLPFRLKPGWMEYRSLGDRERIREKLVLTGFQAGQAPASR